MMCVTFVLSISWVTCAIGKKPHWLVLGSFKEPQLNGGQFHVVDSLPRRE